MIAARRSANSVVGREARRVGVRPDDGLSGVIRAATPIGAVKEDASPTRGGSPAAVGRVAGRLSGVMAGAVVPLTASSVVLGTRRRGGPAVPPEAL
jgi:hypothetical protein